MTREEMPSEARPRDQMQSSTAPRALADLLNRVLDRGVVLGGDVTLSVAGVDLVYLRLSTLLTSVATAREKLAGSTGGRPAPEPLEASGMAGRLPSLARAVEPPHAPEPEPGSAGLHSPAHTPELEHPVPPTQQKHAPDAPPRSEGLSTPAHSSGSGME